MNKEDLIKLGVAEDVADKIIVLHGKDIESHKQKLTTAETELTGIKAQMVEANKTIEGFKSLNVDQIKASAEEWKAKAEKATTDAQAQISGMKFDHALESALTGAKAKDVIAVKAHLKTDVLKLEEDGSIFGLDEQLKKIKSEKDYLFEGEEKTPKIVAGGNNKPVPGSDPFMDIVRKSAGLKVEKDE